MIHGEFILGLPFFQTAVGWEDKVKTSNYLLDTGFTGDMQISYDTARELNLGLQGTEPTRLADGRVVSMHYSTVIASLEGENQYVQAFISEGSSLVGLGLLKKFGYKAEIDCKKETLALERAN